MANKTIGPEYKEWLSELISKIRDSQLRANLKVNTEMLSLYWDLGKAIVEKQANSNWGDKVIPQLATDLSTEFKDKGFSRSNLFNIRKWYQFYSQDLQLVQQRVGLIEAENQPIDNQIVQQRVGQFPILLGLIPWGHHIQIFTRSHSIEEAMFYIRQTASYNWKRTVLIHHIDSNLYHRKGKAHNNFEFALPKAQSELAIELLKNPYSLDFLNLSEEASERDMENGILANIKKFLLELGSGFSFYGQQFHIQVGDKDYYIDLIFYHTRLHCYFVVELKVTEFEAEHMGKLDFYITAIDEQIKMPEDKPTIGLLLCKTVDKVIAEYSLKSKTKPMGIAEYKHKIPDEWREELPDEELLRNELAKEVVIHSKPIDEKMGKLKNLIQRLNTEEAQLERTDELVEKVFEEAGKPLISLIDIRLTALKNEFNQAKITILKNGGVSETYKGNIDPEMKIPLDNIWKLEFEFALEGFKKAGTKAFDVWQKLEIRFEKYRYCIGTEKERTWEERLYHKMLNQKELDSIADQFKGVFLDNIHSKIEQLFI